MLSIFAKDVLRRLIVVSMPCCCWLATTMVFGQQPNAAVINAGRAQQGSSTTRNLPPEIVQGVPPAESQDEGSGSRSRIQSDLPRDLLLPPPSAEAQALAKRFIANEIDPELTLKLVVGRPKILQLSALPTKVYSPTNDIFRIEPVVEGQSNELAIFGLRPGTSTLTLFFNDPNAANGESIVSYLVRVFDDPIFTRPIEELASDINRTFPNSYVQLEELGGRLIVSGQARDAIELSQILQVLVGARGVQEEPVAAELRRSLAALPSDSPDAQTARQALEIITNDAESRRDVDPVALAQAGIINRMTIPGEQQVDLRVVVAQVNRSAARSIGLNLDIQNSTGTVFGQFSGDILSTAGAGGGGVGVAAGAASNLLASLDAGQVTLAIEALRNLSLARTLAEPNLVALNGQTANFQSGGQFPIPVIGSGGVGGGTNLQGVSFVPFGVQLQFTPLIRDRDVIRLQINADISGLDASVGTSIGGGAGGTAVSGLSNQSFQTTVELRSGQTLAVAGLIESSFAGASERVPWWGDLPLIGNTGGARDVTSSETELVILVTPELTAPLGNNAKFPLPGDDIHEPTDIEFYLANRLESRRSKDYRATVRTDRARQRNGDVCPADKFMIGSVGPTDRCSAVFSPSHVPFSRNGEGNGFNQSPAAEQVNPPVPAPQGSTSKLPPDTSRVKSSRRDRIR